MSQNDHNIANGNGATVRADINSSLQALASNNGGSSAPSTTYPNEWWFDTTNDILKIRDEANANWVNAFSLVGTTWIPYSNGAVLGTIANLAYAAINQNLTMSAKHVAFATTAVSSGTPDFSASGNVVTLSATATANTLGTVQAGFIGVVHYGVAITITHNAGSRILPTGANITTTVGDVEIVLSLGSGNWRTISYMRADGTAVGAGAASQAQMEAGSATGVFVAPATAQFHPSAAKFWAYVTVSAGTPTLQSPSYNVTSITDTALGKLTVTIATDFSSANWCCQSNIEWATGEASGQCCGVDPSGQAAGSVVVRCMSTGASSNATLQDPNAWHVAGYGDQ